MEHAERPTAELASPPGHKRSLHSLIPLAAAGALALVAWGFAWMQSQNTPLMHAEQSPPHSRIIRGSFEGTCLETSV